MDWVLPSQVSYGEDTRFYYNYPGNIDSYFLQLKHHTDGGYSTDIDGRYQGRVVGHFTIQNRSVGFTLRELGPADAGTYGCRHSYDFHIVENFTSVLFLYGKRDFRD